MDRPTAIPLRIGAWRVDPALGQIARDGETIRLEGRALRLLLCLAERVGEVVSSDELLKRVWPDVVVTPDSVYQAIASLRRSLGDDPKQPTYIVTVPRLGYRMVAPVTPWLEEPAAVIELSDKSSDIATESSQSDGPARVPRRRVAVIAAAVTFAIAIIGLFLYHRIASTSVAAPPNSVAVLPFLDLTTQEMTEEYFADGMTEELINKLSRNSHLRVPSPTASFFYKGKQVPPATIGKALDVSYLVDGSIRKSGAMLRISARLLRAEDGYVLWSETYDRPTDDELKVQDDIARAISKALSESVPHPPP